MKKTTSDDRLRIPVLHHQVDIPAQVRDAETGKTRRQDQQSRDNAKTECQTLADTQAVQFFYFFYDILGELAVSPELGAQWPINYCFFKAIFGYSWNSGSSRKSAHCIARWQPCGLGRDTTQTAPAKALAACRELIRGKRC
ncbi:MAG TPA: hypothetical protein VL051_08090 [Burkholderiaceae bacterium]|nr:hypothetical protein [Burkholderiaceae bacterium]